MPWSHTKKLAVIRNVSAPIIDIKKDLEKASLYHKLETVKRISYNVNLNKENEEVLTLINSAIEAHLLSQGYSTQLPLKILDTLWGLTTINKQQVSKQGIVIAGFEISNTVGQTQWFQETFFISDIPQPAVFDLHFLKL